MHFGGCCNLQFLVRERVTFKYNVYRIPPPPIPPHLSLQPTCFEVSAGIPCSSAVVVTCSFLFGRGLPSNTTYTGSPPPPPLPLSLQLTCFEVSARVPCSSAVVVTCSFFFGEVYLQIQRIQVPPPLPLSLQLTCFEVSARVGRSSAVVTCSCLGGGGGGADTLARVLRTFRGLEFGRVGQSWTLSRVQVAAFLSRGINYKTRGCRPCEPSLRCYTPGE